MPGGRRLGSCFVVGGVLLALGCGERSSESREAPDTDGAELVGGQPDAVSAAVVALVLRAGAGWDAFCSGTLIAPNLVLTARHCLSVIDGQDEQGVVCGVTLFGDDYDSAAMRVAIDADTTDGTPTASLFPIADVAHFPSNDDPCNNDVSLLLLDRNVAASLATPITPRIAAPPAVNSRFSAVGYGLTSPDDTEGTTSGRRLRVDDNTTYCVSDGCWSEVDSSIVGDREWIGNSPACPGDSGGPALDLQGRVSGVASRGDELCSVAIYGHVSSFSGFIVAAAQQAATVGGYPVPTWAGGSGAPAPVDAGAPDASAPVRDAGSAPSDAGADPFEPDAAAEPTADAAPPAPRGNGDAGAGSSPTPVVDLTGESCATDCPGVYACYLEDDEPPGICVPPCADEAPRCPEDYACSSRLDVCVPARGKRVTASCAFAPPGRDGSFVVALFAAAALLQRFSARRSSKRK